MDSWQFCSRRWLSRQKPVGTCKGQFLLAIVEPDVTWQTKPKPGQTMNGIRDGNQLGFQTDDLLLLVSESR